MGTATAQDIRCYECEVRDKAICAALEPHELYRLNAIVTEIRLEKNRPVFHQQDPASHLFNVTEGVVRLSILLADGRRQITGFLYPGDFLGVPVGAFYAYQAEAVSALRLCRFPRDKLLALFDDLPKLEHRMLAMATNELTAAQRQMLLLGRKTAAEKVVSFLLDLAERCGAAGQPAETVDVPMTRVDIADYLGMTTETVSRTLHRLVVAGLIALPTAQHIVLRDRAALLEIAGGS